MLLLSYGEELSSPPRPRLPLEEKTSERIESSVGRRQFLLKLIALIRFDDKCAATHIATAYVCCLRRQQSLLAHSFAAINSSYIVISLTSAAAFVFISIIIYCSCIKNCWQLNELKVIQSGRIICLETPAAYLPENA